MFGNFNDTNSPRPLKSGRGELLILLFLHHKLAVFGVHGQLAVVHLSGHNGAGAQGFQLALDQALHRARAVDGIVALLHQQIDGCVGHSQLYLTLRQALAQVIEQQIDNAAHLIAAEGREDHGVVDTVEEFGLEGAAQNGLHALAGFLAKGAAFADAVQDLAAAQVAGHDQDGVFEVHRPTLTVGHAAVVEICSRMLNTSGCAFSISSNSTTE